MNKHGLQPASDALCAALAAERGVDATMFRWLRDRGLLLANQGWPAFPVLDSAGETIGVRVRRSGVNGDGHDWSYTWFGTDKTVAPLVVGNLETAQIVWLFESPWDAIAALATHRWHLVSAFNHTIAAVITCGATNGAKIRGLILAGKRILAFPQNDPVKNPGKPTAAEKWLADVVAHAGAPVMVVKTPPQFKDLNDWVKAGVKLPNLHDAISEARPAHIAPLASIELIGLDDQDEEVDAEDLPFPTDALPSPYSNMVREVARVAQVPEAIPSMVALAAISTAAGQSINAGLLPGKLTGPNIYMVTVARSGTGKSSAAEPLLAPLHDIQSSRLDQWQRETRPRLDARKNILMSELDGLIRSAKKPTGPEQRQKLETDVAQKQAALYLIEDALVEPRLICEDVTIQQLACLLQQNDETMALISTDAGEVTNNLLGRYNKLDRADDALIVKAFTMEPQLVDRKGRPSVSLKHPSLTLLLMIQPDKLASLLHSRQLVEGGFLPRCLMARIDGELEHWRTGVRDITPSIRSAYTKHLTDMTNALRLGKQRHTIQVAPEAQEILMSYANEVIDLRMAPSSRLDSFRARWAEQACRLSVVLHAAKWGPEAAKQVLDADTARAGVSLARWFARQQERLLGAGEADELQQVLTGLRNLARQKTEGFTSRDVCRAGVCDNADDAKRYLVTFVAKGILLETKRDTDGRPKVVYQFKGGAA